MSGSSNECRGIGRPILSVCIPTYNRAECLDLLLENLEKIKIEHAEWVEICVSNNHSTDETSKVIQKWQDRFEFKVLTQEKNIGATRNCFAVAHIATGKWLMVVGDDDGVVLKNFSHLMKRLLISNEGDWLLAGVADLAGDEYLLGSLREGRYDSKAMKKCVLKTGLYRYGFLGMHVFPSVLKGEFVSLTLEQAQPWPHLALFLRHIQHGYVQVFSAPVVQQAGGGSVLFWAIFDMAHIKLRKLNIIAEARSIMGRNKWFADFLLLRELYLARDIRTLLFWKALEPDDFNRRALHEYGARYLLLKPSFMFFSVFHGMLLFVVYIMPAPMLRMLLGLIGQRSWMKSYDEKKQTMEAFNGIKRGV